MSRPLALAVAWIGVATMVAASFYAPAQPELLQDGAACELAQCGTLEDPERWRTAWWVWGTGLVLRLRSAGPGGRHRRRSVEGTTDVRLTEAAQPTRIRT